MRRYPYVIGVFFLGRAGHHRHMGRYENWTMGDWKRDLVVFPTTFVLVPAFVLAFVFVQYIVRIVQFGVSHRVPMVP